MSRRTPQINNKLRLTNFLKNANSKLFNDLLNYFTMLNDVDEIEDMIICGIESIKKLINVYACVPLGTTTLNIQSEADKVLFKIGSNILSYNTNINNLHIKTEEIKNYVVAFKTNKLDYLDEDNKLFEEYECVVAVNFYAFASEKYSYYVQLLQLFKQFEKIQNYYVNGRIAEFSCKPVYINGHMQPFNKKAQCVLDDGTIENLYHLDFNTTNYSMFEKINPSSYENNEKYIRSLNDLIIQYVKWIQCSCNRDPNGNYNSFNQSFDDGCYKLFFIDKPFNNLKYVLTKSKFGGLRYDEIIQLIDERKHNFYDREEKSATEDNNVETETKINNESMILTKISELENIIREQSNTINELKVAVQSLCVISKCKVCKYCRNQQSDNNFILNCGCMNGYCFDCIEIIKQTIKEDSVFKCLICNRYVTEVIFIKK